MNNILKGIILSLMVFSNLAFVSCSDNDDDAPRKENNLTFIDNLPDAENIKSTSAYIPVYDKGIFQLRFGMNADLNTFYIGGYILSSYLAEDSCGFYLSGLEPDATYYYTMVCQIGNETIASNQVKSFTTKGVGIEFIEPETVSMGNWERKIPRVKTIDIEDSEVPLNLFVQFYIWRQRDPSNVGLSAVTTYAGDGIWKDDNSLEEGVCYQAFVKTHSGRVVAKTPVVLWTNGSMVELQEQ